MAAAPVRSVMVCRLPRSCLILAVLAGAVIRLSAAEGEPTVALPPFIVEEMKKGPPWRYGETPGYEILSRCPDAVTRRVVDAHFDLHQLLGEILPPQLRLKLTVPRSMIIYDEELVPAASQEVVRKLLNEPSVPPVDEGPALGAGRGFRLNPPAPRYNFLPNLRLWDRDSMGVFMIVRRDDLGGGQLALTPDYVAFVLKRRVPSLPVWFVSGLLDFYAVTTYGRGELNVDPMEWISREYTSAVKSDPKKAPPVLPLGSFLAGAMPVIPPELPVAPLKAWQAQAHLFVRWGLDADKHAHREALWAFAERSALEGSSEQLFSVCFGFGYEEAQARLSAYLPAAVRRSLTFRPERKVKPPELVLSNATDGQIARLKGDWERLEVPYVRVISADLAPKYLEQARRTLRRAYDRNERDPRLLAVMGLCEVDAGEEAAARELLEAARNLGEIRPRANYELARLRLADFRQHPAAPDGKLDVNQTAEVLHPLFSARGGEPPMPEVYELIGEAWNASVAMPTAGHLAVLDEGVRLFPRSTHLVLIAAELRLQHGFREEAAALAHLAAQTATESRAKSRLAALQARLEGR